MPRELPLIPSATASWLSRASFAWIGPFIRAHRGDKELTADDVFSLGARRQAAALADGLLAHLHSLRAERRSDKPVMLRAIFRTLPHEIIWTVAWAVPLLLGVGLTMVSKQLSRFCAESWAAARSAELAAPALTIGIGFVVGISAVFLVIVVITAQCTRNWASGDLLRLSLSAAVVRKAMRLSERSRSRFPPSKLLSLMTTDGDQLNGALGRMQGMSRMADRLTYQAPSGAARWSWRSSASLSACSGRSRFSAS